MRTFQFSRACKADSDSEWLLCEKRFKNNLGKDYLRLAEIWPEVYWVGDGGDGVPLLLWVKWSIMADSVDVSYSWGSGVPPLCHFVSPLLFRITPLDITGHNQSALHGCLFGTKWLIEAETNALLGHFERCFRIVNLHFSSICRVLYMSLNTVIKLVVN